MGEPIWCTIKVKVPPMWDREGVDQPEPAEVLDTYSFAFEMIEVDEPGVWTFSGEGNYGLYDSDIEEMLNTLREHRIPFIARSDTKYEFCADYWVYDGAEQTERQFAGDTEQVMLTHDTWTKIKAGIHEHWSSVDDYFGAAMRPITEFDIDHLPDQPPNMKEVA